MRAWDWARVGPKLRTHVVRLGHCGRGNRPASSMGTEPIFAVSFATEKRSRPAFRMGGVACTPKEKCVQIFWQVGLGEFQVSFMQRLLGGHAPRRWRHNIICDQRRSGKGAAGDVTGVANRGIFLASARCRSMPHALKSVSHKIHSEPPHTPRQISNVQCYHSRGRDGQRSPR